MHIIWTPVDSVPCLVHTASMNWSCGSSQNKHACAAGTINVSCTPHPTLFQIVKHILTFHFSCLFGDTTVPKGPVDPPPVVRLQISRSVMRPSSQPQSHLKPPATANSDDSNLSSESGLAQSKANQASKLTSASLIQSPYLFCFAALCKADEDEELYLLADGKTRYVTGNVVSSLYHLKDPRDGSAEGFFVFPGKSTSSPLLLILLIFTLFLVDIGVRVEGTFRLKLSLYEMVE